ncbi:uncharacterized protein LOC121467592 [Drosophila elegans]|uniref:uncharacterized protein LOC121467592 n=1 Tax=Drosophila elegans TaxID=30023 RepID=UPI001BC85DFC|nr:uncharacterized protein LOC121467592 [Drosophila elegans]
MEEGKDRNNIGERIKAKIETRTRIQCGNLELDITEAVADRNVQEQQVERARTPSPDRDILELHPKDTEAQAAEAQAEGAAAGHETEARPDSQAPQAELFTNEMGWILPRDATMSARAVDEIKERWNRRRKGKQQSILVKDERKTWKFFAYPLHCSNSKLGNSTDRTSAVFKEWDYENPATVFVASRNIKGISVNRSRLEVPELSDAMDRRCQHLAHDDNTQILSWTKPVEEKNLEGYFVYWCNKTTCQADSTTELKYDLSDMSPNRMAVAANYGADKSGGMKWLHEDQVGVTGRIRYVEGILALLVLGVFFLGVRKLRNMAKIDVKVPPGVLMPRAPFDPDQSPLIQPYQGIPHPRMLYSDLKKTEPPDDYPDVQIEVEFEVEVEEGEESQEPEPMALPCGYVSNGYVTMNTANPILSDGYIKPPPPR